MSTTSCCFNSEGLHVLALALRNQKVSLMTNECQAVKSSFHLSLISPFLSTQFSQILPDLNRRHEVQLSRVLKNLENKTMASSVSDPIRSKNASPERDSILRTKHFSIKDHNEDEVSIAWRTEFRSVRNDTLPPFPFQVYILSSANQVAEDVNFPLELAASIRDEEPENDIFRFHFQVYHRPFPNILACIAHQNREILHRNRNGIAPRMISRWTQTDNGYKGQVIVIDMNDWIDSGVLIVDFDPAENDNRGQIPEWNRAYDGDIDLVNARRIDRTRSLIYSLANLWHNAGASWTEDDLQRRNDGGTSPVLYPAIDPASHYDAEHEEVHELDGTALPGPATQADNDDNDDGLPRIIDTFDPFELFLQEHELREYRAETYSDLLGLPVTSVWSSKLSRTRPEFSFTLYLAFDFFDKLQVHPKALFRCLNKGLVSQEAWTLDIVKNMPSLDAAFQYHSRATAQRTSERCQRRRACIHLIVRKIAGSKLPSEILEHIEDLLLPPAIPKYSARPFRPLKDVFMYLDKGLQYTGPLLVYSNPDDSRINLHATHSGSVSGSVLRLVYQRYWHRVADELHVLWGSCSPRCVETEELAFPKAELELLVPEACVWRSQFGIQFINGYVDVKITFHSDREIVIPYHHGLFSHDLWDECVDILDLETGERLAPLGHVAQTWPICINSWAQTVEQGFRAGAHTFMDPENSFRSFKANERRNLELRPTAVWWHWLVSKGMLKGGRRYAFQLRPGIMIPRWTYGTVGNREGPFNLPPIPITVDETLRPFKFRVESIGAPHGSFNR